MQPAEKLNIRQDNIGLRAADYGHHVVADFRKMPHYPDGRIHPPDMRPEVFNVIGIAVNKQKVHKLSPVNEYPHPCDLINRLFLSCVLWHV